jgi:hypothetical protein
VRFYPHWLDPEEFVQRRAEDDVLTAISDAKRRLKLRALVDPTLVLNDVQPFESRPLLQLFRDPEFVSFLRQAPEFLAMTIRADGEDRGRFWRATRGLRRAREPVWKSSIFDRELIRDLSEALEIDGGLDLRSPRPAVQRALSSPGWRRFMDEREGLLNSIHFFGEESRADITCVVGGTVRTFDDELIEASLSSDRERSARASAALRFIEEHPLIPPDKRQYRSAVLDAIDFSQEEQWRHWKVVVESWNRATELTVGASGGSGIYGAAQAGIGLDRDPILDLSGEATESLKDLSGRIPVIPFALDIDQPWPVILEMRSASSDERLAFWHAHQCGDATDLRDAASDLFAKCARAAVPWKFLHDRPLAKATLMLVSGAALAAGFLLDPTGQAAVGVQTLKAAPPLVLGARALLDLSRIAIKRASTVTTLRRQLPVPDRTNQTRRVIPRA